MCVFLVRPCCVSFFVFPALDVPPINFGNEKTKQTKKFAACKDDPARQRGSDAAPRARARKKKEEETLRGRVVVGGVFLGQCRLFRGRSLSMFARTSTSLFLLASVVSPFCFIHVGLSGPFLPLAHAAAPEGHQEKKEKTKEEASSFPFFSSNQRGTRKNRQSSFFLLPHLDPVNGGVRLAPCR